MKDNLSSAHSDTRPPDREARPSIPSTPLAARAAQPWFRERAIEAYRRYVAAKRELQRCRDEAAAVDDVARGEFETHAVGSNGPWPVLGAYRELSLADWAKQP